MLGKVMNRAIQIGMLCMLLGLVGCSKSQMREASMYEKAGVIPVDGRELPFSHLEGVVESSKMRHSTGKVDDPRLQQLEQYLLANQIPYQAYSGYYTLVKIEPTFQFNLNSAKLSASQKQQLAQLVNAIRYIDEVDFVIEGHTDRQGETMYNENLSLARAKAVERVLRKQGIKQDKLFARGFGASMPACSNKTAQGRVCNRRVMLSLLLR